MVVPPQHETIMRIRTRVTMPIITPNRVTRSRITRALTVAAALTFPSGGLVSAQDTKPLPRTGGDNVIIRSNDVPLVWLGSRDRAVLGVTLGASTRADTAGVRVEEVQSDGPAAKAGLKAGDVITDVNGVNLRVSSADAEDLALAGVAQRRLQRTLAKAKPGDEVTLRVRTGAAAPRAVTVKTVSAAELDGSRVRSTITRRDDATDTRGAIGVTITATNSVRDTLGLFVTSVTGKGPAENAGVIEGERIAAVNGVDVRVPKEDIEDAAATSARINRFVREVQKVAPGSAVTLRVYGNGRYRDVSVSAVKMSEIAPAGAVRINGMINGTPMNIDSQPFEEMIQRLRGRLEGAGGDVRVRTITPRSGGAGTVRAITVPKAGLTRM